jgi:tripeptidyl-peptidase-2
VAHLAKLREEDRRDDFRTLEKRLSGDLSNHLPFLMERLRFLAPEKGEPAAPKEIVAAADAVIRRVDRDAVAAALGREADPEDDAEKEARAEREEQRDFLVEALRTKAIALARMDAPGDALEETYRELERWADLEDDANAELLVIREQRRGRPAVALGVLDGLLDDGPAKRELYETRVELLEELGWTDRADRERSWLLIRRPEGYPPF